jgi:hypothetical protein
MQRLNRAGALRFAIWVVVGLAVPLPWLSRPAVGLQAGLVPHPILSGGLGGGQSEVPRPLPDQPTCAACRLAAQTTGQLAPETVQLRAVVLRNGVALSATAKDPSARDMLWKATIARGELLSALRNGAPVKLCRACRNGLDRMAELRIDARRTPAGIDLVYTSSDVRVVHDLHQVAREFDRTQLF